MTFDPRSEGRFRSIKTSVVALAVAAAAFTGAATASADSATAEALFRDGKALMAQNQFDQACGKFAESDKQDHQLGTLLALADCFSKAGKTASEWAAYNQIAFEAKKKGDAARAEAAAAKASALEPNLSKMTITTDAKAPGLQIRRDGEDIGTGALGTAIPVDPGSHVIEATAPGYEVWQTTVTVGPNHDTKNVQIPSLTKKPEGGAGAEGGTPPNPTRRNIGFVVGGVGVAGLGVGIVTGILAISDKNAADMNCPNKACNAMGRAKVDSASTKALISTIGFGVGIAGIGAGVALILTSRGSQPAADAAPPPAAPTAKLVPMVGPTGGGLSLLGTF